MPACKRSSHLLFLLNSNLLLSDIKSEHHSLISLIPTSPSQQSKWNINLIVMPLLK